MRRRAQWFVPLYSPYFAMWWVPIGIVPTLADALADWRVWGVTAHRLTPVAVVICGVSGILIRHSQVAPETMAKSRWLVFARPFRHAVSFSLYLNISTGNW